MILQPALQITPINFREANAWIEAVHRHHAPVIGAKFCIAVSTTVQAPCDGSQCFDMVVGVAIVGRPVSRHRDDSWTLEVNRVATDGTPNACSALYGAAWSAAKALGYRRLITYILAEEPGTSLRAAGWNRIGERRSGNWNVASRPRVDTDELLRGQKVLWETF